MIVRDIVAIAMRALRANKLRSGLTMLGLVIGVAAVILLTSFGQGLTNSVNAAVAPIANSVTVVPKLSPIPGGPPAEPLTDSDVQALAAIPQIDQMVPFVSGSSTGAAGQVSRAVTASVPGAQYLSASVMGTTANFPAAAQKSVSAGTFFSQTQSDSGAHVVVLGPLIATALYGQNPDAPLGRQLRINHALFQVIGVMESFGANNDNVIIMPMKAARSGVFGFGKGGDEVSGLYIKAISTQEVKNVENQVYDVMRRQHGVRDARFDDFQVQDLGSRLSTFTNLISLIAGFVPAVAAISLLVGGIGVLNIMLVSVTDRTREIGTRKAVGASDGAILTQFTLEATTLGGFGGLIGVLFAIGLIVAAKMAIPALGGSQGFLATFSPVLSAPPILVAFTISLLIGLVAGGYPAWRAARLEPIEALRYE
ncbi:ABC transporter permease [Pseudonocardia spinosispora]|uniref:ABC transporter permease n=1 Tax=Pseudonocardia spinosispora TaxID=103441 RepID=UPI00042864DF|nr:ABC transporter permease [Pseudonocardia spinosispora]